MVMNLDYMLTTIFAKHTADSIHGNDPMYDIAYVCAKEFYEELKNDPAFKERYRLKHLEHAFTAIDSVRESNIEDKELVEFCIRHYLYDELKYIVAMRS